VNNCRCGEAALVLSREELVSSSANNNYRLRKKKARARLAHEMSLSD
jgi:hypothetical protein